MASKPIDPKTLDLQPAIALWNAHTDQKPTRSDALWDRLDELTRKPGETQGPAVLIMDGARINSAETADALRFYSRHGVTPPGAKSVKQLREEMEHEETEADPISGLPLWKGKTPGGRADWSSVSKADREVVAYGVSQGEIFGASESVIYGVTKTPDAPPWPRLRQEWAALQAKAAKDPEAAVQVTRVRARLIAKPTAQGGPAQPPFAGSKVECAADGQIGCPGWRGACAESGEIGKCDRRIPAAAAVQIQGDVRQSTIITGNGSVVDPNDRPALRRLLSERLVSDPDVEAYALDHFPKIHGRFSGGMQRTAKISLLLEYASGADLIAALEGSRSQPPTSHKILVLHVEKERSDFYALVTHLAPIVRDVRPAKLEIVGPTAIGAGSIRRNQMADWQNSAVVTLALLSADAQADDEFAHWVDAAKQNARRTGRPVVPVLVRHCLLGDFAAQECLPSDHQPVYSWSRCDEAWGDVARGVRRILVEQGIIAK